MLGRFKDPVESVSRVLIISWFFYLLRSNKLPSTIIIIICVCIETFNDISNIIRIIFRRCRDRSWNLRLQIIRNSLPWGITDKVKGNSLISVWCEGPFTCKENFILINYLAISVIAIKFPSTLVIKVHVGRLTWIFHIYSIAIIVSICITWRQGLNCSW